MDEAVDNQERGAQTPHTAFGDPAQQGRIRRSVKLLLVENGFASALGATLNNMFLTGLIQALGGGKFELGVALAAGQVGAMGMLATNPILNHTGSRRRLCLVDLGVVRILRVVLALLPLLLLAGLPGHTLLWPVTSCVLVSSFFGMSAEIARRSWISDLVAPGQRGKFFAQRVAASTLVNVTINLAGGWIYDLLRRQGHPLAGIQILLVFGALAGLVSWLLIYRTYEPPMTPLRRPAGLVRSLLLPWLRPRFRMLLMVTGCWSVGVSFAGSFFNIYMLNYLGMPMIWAAVINTTGDLASVLAAKSFGTWADRVGTRKVLYVGMILKAVFPALWVLATPQSWWVLFLVNLLSVANSGMQICWMRLSLNLSPAKNQVAFLSMHQAMMGLGSGFGALFGGSAAEWLDKLALPVVLGVQVKSLHLLFLLSGLLRAATIPLLGLIREPRKSVEG